MTRTIPPERFSHLVEVATTTFIARGYRLTQMADIAETLGVAKGTLYGYVESKEALFDAALRYADGHLPEPSTEALPLPTPTKGATVEYVRGRLSAEAEDLMLVKVLGGSLVTDDPVDELKSVLSDMYRRIASNRIALKLIDRCAAEYPDLARAWFGEGRWAQHALLVQLLQSRAHHKRFRKVAHPDLVARSIIETIAFWAMHRHFDPSPQRVDDDQAQAAIVDLLVHGIVK